MTNNIDEATVRGFGDEWTAFKQDRLSDDEHEQLFQAYFRIFPWAKLPAGARGFDAGCGSGRWAAGVAPRVGSLICLDASADALRVAQQNLGDARNVEFLHAPIEESTLKPAGMDFGYSLGVLHHIPDTDAALRACVSWLKPGAPFLLYLYYAFDNRPWWFRGLWKCSDIMRRGISRLPFPARKGVTTVIAAVGYWPLARVALMLEKSVGCPSHWPLRFYRDKSFYTMRTDSLDRFGTRLEQRFSRRQIVRMMKSAGLVKIATSDDEPYWTAVGYRGPATPATA